jgi:hypothetical protein
MGARRIWSMTANRCSISLAEPGFYVVGKLPSNRTRAQTDSRFGLKRSRGIRYASGSAAPISAGDCSPRCENCPTTAESHSSVGQP